MITHLGLVQMRGNRGRRGNIERAHALIRDAAAKGAQIIVLPECFHDEFFVTEFNNDLFDLAETIPGPIIAEMQALAAECTTVIVVPIFEQAGAGVYYNSAAVIDADGQLLGIYRKTHVPLNPTFKEKYYFKPGNLGYPVFETRFGRLGVMICHDRHYPEVCRCLALAGAEIVVVPTATHTGTPARAVWELELAAHAVFNELFVGGVNRVGTEGSLSYFGASAIFGPSGELLAQADSEDEEIVLAACDFSAVEERRRNWHFFRDRRPDTYVALTRSEP